jgi:hypothetical protein
MRKSRSAFLLCLALSCLAGGCASGMAGPSELAAFGTGDAMYERSAGARLDESLFKDDQAVMGNDELKTVLGSKVELPSRAKLAVVRFGRLPYWWGWSEDFVRLNEQIDADFLGKLRTSGRLRDVAYLPSMVTPSTMTIPHLRQAAARLQADLILVYRTSTYNYEKHRWFRAPRTKAYCTVAAVLVDTRTGVIPFSTVVSERYAATQGKKDYQFDETVARAEQQAISRAWLRLAEESVGFLDAAPQ